MSANDPERTSGLLKGTPLVVCHFSPAIPSQGAKLGQAWSLWGNMHRRNFITLIGSAMLVWPLTARAQRSERVRQIGLLMAYSESDREGQADVAAFREGLQKLGWVDGRNIHIDIRRATKAKAIEQSARDLVTLKPELILSLSSATTAALLQQTRTIPIVFANIGDPVGSGFVASFARPGGNATGFIPMEASVAGKWLELLKEIAPRISRVAFLFNPAMAPFEHFLNPLKAAAKSIAVEVIAAPVRDTSELGSAIAAQAQEPNGGLIFMPDAFNLAHSAEITLLAARYRSLPSIHSASLLNTAACCHTAVTGSIIFGARRTMSISSLRARSRLTFRCKPRPNTSWLSTSRQQRPWTSPCPYNSSNAPTK